MARARKKLYAVCSEEGVLAAVVMERSAGHVLNRLLNDNGKYDLDFEPGLEHIRRLRMDRGGVAVPH
ncbi:MAG: hypothetical protein JRL30_29815 [Deltaproteobacteria bacterium]|nr:hypothetical protein [Deltaproteobacteria bacterium]